MKPFLDFLIEEKRGYSEYINAITSLLNKTHERVEIGSDNGIPIYLWKSYQPRHLITAGWQGDEPAGWLACLELAESGNKFLSYLPVACPSAFITGQHMDWQGFNADRGYPNPNSESGRVISAVTETLASLAPQGHLSLQEDPHRSFAYAYSWGNSPMKKVIDILDNPSGGLFVWDKGERIPKQKGMFCEHLHDHGVPFCIQTETPADGTVSLDKRVNAQVKIVESITQP